jgi:hypothetical protein
MCSSNGNIDQESNRSGHWHGNNTNPDGTGTVSVRIVYTDQVNCGGVKAAFEMAIANFAILQCGCENRVGESQMETVVYGGFKPVHPDRNAL